MGSYDDYEDAVRAADFIAAQGPPTVEIRIDGENLRAAAPDTAPRNPALAVTLLVLTAAIAVLLNAAAGIAFAAGSVLAILVTRATRPRAPAAVHAARYTVVIDER